MASMLYQRSANVLFSDLGNDVVALQIDLGHCYGMQDGTAAIWNLLGNPTSVEQIVDRLVEDYDVVPATCRADVERVIGQMVQEGLVAAVGEREATT